MPHDEWAIEENLFSLKICNSMFFPVLTAVAVIPFKPGAFHPGFHVYNNYIQHPRPDQAQTGAEEIEGLPSGDRGKGDIASGAAQVVDWGKLFGGRYSGCSYAVLGLSKPQTQRANGCLLGTGQDRYRT